MLVLRRKLGEGIAIGDKVRLMVVEIQGNQVKLGIEAPRGISIHRLEVMDRIAAENSLAKNALPNWLMEVLRKGSIRSSSTKT